jgi:Rieske Fe-S protein
MSDNPSTASPGPSRRSMLRGLAVGGLGLPLLAACGGGGTTSSGGSAAPSGPSGNGGGLATTADVPVGGGIILTGPQVVLTQPAKGGFKAFSAICTHMGCPVSEVTHGAIVCPCHGSQFSIKDGSVLGGPAPSPLPAVKITVKGNEIIRA